MPKVILEKEKCIGCGTCEALCSKFFEVKEDGKSHLKGAEESAKEELLLEDVGCSKDAADACPVQCIQIHL